MEPGDVIRYKDSVSEDTPWVRAVLTERTGRIGTANQNSFNVDRATDSDRINCDKLYVDKLETRIEDYLKQNQLMMMDDEETEIIFLSETGENSVPYDPRINEAKNVELSKFKYFDVYEEDKDIGQEVISTRWVVTKKGEAYKARLVARGFEELSKNISDAPTVAKSTERLFFTLEA